MTNPKVSVIIPLYNQEKYFEKCISSVSAQTYKNIEIIIVNDGSTDNSLAIAQKWSQKDNRIIILDKKNGGLSRARKDGLMMATGEFFTPVDSDDYLPNNAIEILTKHMVEQNVDVVLGSMARVLGCIKRYHYYDDGSFPFNQVISVPELFDKYYPGFFGKRSFPNNVCARLYRKSVVDKALKETNLFSEDILFMGEDHYFNMKLFPYLQSMYRTNENVYYYRYGGLSIDHFNPHFTELFALSEESLKILDKYNLNQMYSSVYIGYSNYLYYHAQQLLQYHETDNEGVIDFFKKELNNRALVKRMIDYFSKDSVENEGLRLILKYDYEGMYNFAYKQMKDNCSTMGYRFRKILHKIFA